MEREGRGYESNSKLACEHCVGDVSLKDFVVKNGTQEDCDFCERTAKCVLVEELTAEILKVIFVEYDKAVNCMAWDNGEYQGAPTWDTQELMDHLMDQFGLQEDLHKEVTDTIDQDTWCKKDPYGS